MIQLLKGSQIVFKASAEMQETEPRFSRFSPLRGSGTAKLGLVKVTVPRVLQHSQHHKHFAKCPVRSACCHGVIDVPNVTIVTSCDWISILAWQTPLEARSESKGVLTHACPSIRPWSFFRSPFLLFVHQELVSWRIIRIEAGLSKTKRDTTRKTQVTRTMTRDFEGLSYYNITCPGSQKLNDYCALLSGNTQKLNSTKQINT